MGPTAFTMAEPAGLLVKLAKGSNTPPPSARAESASPATGSHKAHVLEEQQIMNQAFEPARPR